MRESDMATITMDESQVKNLFKQALLELFEERRDLFYGLYAEILEDAGMISAIREGKESYTVSRKDVYRYFPPMALL
jgi:hypothetical protein